MGFFSRKNFFLPLRPRSHALRGNADQDALRPVRRGAERQVIALPRRAWERGGIASIFIFSILSILSSPAFTQTKMPLEECYRLALERSEAVAITKEEIARAQARYQQALGVVLPKINIFASELLQDSSANNNGADGSGVGATFTRFSRPEVAVNIYQNLFQGLKEITALKLSKVDKAQQVDRWKDAKRLLYQDVAVSFYTIAQIEMDLASDQKILQVLRSRLGELNDRVELGKSRASELLAQEADISLLEAGIEKEKGLKAVAYQMLAFLTGLDPQPPISYGNPIQNGSKKLEAYLSTIDQRPDVLASQKGVELAKGEVKIRKGDLLPNANAEFNYYPYRVGFQKDIHWDAIFRLGIPVFNFDTFGFINDAKAVAKQSEYKAEEVRRLAESEVKSDYDAFQSSLKQIVKYQRAAKKSEESYRAQVGDFQLGIITNLDVLQAQRVWFASLNQLNDAIAQAWTDQVKLEIASGKIP
jgi:outer membrane protein